MSEDDDRGNIDTPHTEIPVLSLAVLTLCPLVTSQPEATPTTRTASAAFDLRAVLEELPEHVGLVVVLPAPARTAERLAEVTRGVDDVYPEWSAATVLGRVHGSALLLQTAGVDPHGRITVVPGLGRGPDVVRLSLADRARYQAWARTLGGGRAIQTWGGDEVHAVGFDDRSGVACVARSGGLWCQLGASTPDDPLGALRRVVDAPARRLAQNAPMNAAVARLRGDADLYVLARPGELAEPLAHAIGAQAVRARPFATPAEKRGLEAEARRRINQTAAYASLVRAAASAVALDKDELDAQVELELSDRGVELARALVGDLDAADPIVRWAETPSLGRVVARVDPAAAAELLALARVRLHPRQLSGTLAMMVLGIDTQCPSAKASAPRDIGAWPFVFPLAGAIGLAEARPIDRVGLAAGFDIPADPRATELRDDTFFRGRMFDSPVEARLVPQTILLGTGHGAASAAARRWSSPARTVALQASPAPASRRFLDARVSLAGVSAAMSTGTYDGETRPELRRLENVMRVLQPMVGRYPNAHATAQVGEGGRRLTLRMAVGN